MASPGSSYSHDPFTALVETDENAIKTAYGAEVKFYHIPSDTSISFWAFLENFSDTYTPNWPNNETVYGRQDTIDTFANTTRKITIEWAIPAYNIDHARENLRALSRLVQFLYPSYVPRVTAGATGDSSNVVYGGTTTLSSAPMLKVKFGNLICDPSVLSSDEPLDSSDSTAKVGGILCRPDGGISINPDIEQGFFVESFGQFFAKMYHVSVSLVVKHQFPIGWSARQFRTPNFPYGLGVFPPTDLSDGNVEQYVEPEAVNYTDDPGLSVDSTYNEVQESVEQSNINVILGNFAHGR